MPKIARKERTKYVESFFLSSVGYLARKNRLAKAIVYRKELPIFLEHYRYLIQRPYPHLKKERAIAISRELMSCIQAVTQERKLTMPSVKDKFLTFCLATHSTAGNGFVNGEPLLEDVATLICKQLTAPVDTSDMLRELTELRNEVDALVN